MDQLGIGTYSGRPLSGVSLGGVLSCIVTIPRCRFQVLFQVKSRLFECVARARLLLGRLRLARSHALCDPERLFDYLTAGVKAHPVARIAREYMYACYLTQWIKSVALVRHLPASTLQF